MHIESFAKTSLKRCVELMCFAIESYEVSESWKFASEMCWEWSYRNCV